MHNDIANRIVSVRQELRLTQAEFGAIIGASQRSVQGYEKARGLPPAEALVKLAELGFDPYWILTGRGGMRLSGADSSQRRFQSQTQGSASSIEALPEQAALIEQLAFSASAGNGALVIQETGKKFPVRKDLLERFNLRAEHACMVEAVGTSMVPTINDRDFLIVDKSPAARELIREGEIYLFTLDDEAYIKRLRRDYGRWIMVSDNHELFPPRPVPEGEHFQIIGRVCWGARAL